MHITIHYSKNNIFWLVLKTSVSTIIACMSVFVYLLYCVVLCRTTCTKVFMSNSDHSFEKCLEFVMSACESVIKPTIVSNIPFILVQSLHSGGFSSLDSERETDFSLKCMALHRNVWKLFVRLRNEHTRDGSLLQKLTILFVLETIAFLEAWLHQMWVKTNE